ncbi:hypothetical protein EON65_39040 [archaeon]|nr:MAG: hypothetical protein EON65_39040 [archaeon]
MHAPRQVYREEASVVAHAPWLHVELAPPGPGHLASEHAEDVLALHVEFSALGYVKMLSLVLSLYIPGAFVHHFGSNKQRLRSVACAPQKLPASGQAPFLLPWSIRIDSK